MAGMLSQGKQPNPARQITQGFGQSLLQILQPALLTPAAQFGEGAETGGSHALKLGRLAQPARPWELMNIGR